MNCPVLKFPVDRSFTAPYVFKKTRRFLGHLGIDHVRFAVFTEIINLITVPNIQYLRKNKTTYGSSKPTKWQQYCLLRFFIRTSVIGLSFRNL